MLTQFGCSECQPGYNLFRGTCVVCSGPNPAFPCVSCSYDKYVDFTGKCNFPSPYCSTFSQASGWCLSCINGNAPVNGVCCASGWSVVGGLCTLGSSTPVAPVIPKTGSIKDRFPNCRIYSPKTDSCTECMPGHPPSIYGCGVRKP